MIGRSQFHSSIETYNYNLKGIHVYLKLHFQPSQSIALKTFKYLIAIPKLAATVWMSRS